MKKIFLITAAVFYLISVFFITQLNAQAESVEADSIEPGSAEPTISMNFKDADLKDILKALSMQAGMNFIASEAVQDRKVTLYFDKVPLGQVIDKIFSANNLSYELDSKANIFVVKEWGKMETQTITKVFYLKNASVSTSSLKAALSSNSSASGVSASGGKWIKDGESGITSAIRKLLSKDGLIMEDFRTNSLIVTETPMKMQMISQVIASLDLPVLQVLLEVEMLDVSKEVVDKLGFEFGESPFTAILTGASVATGFPFGSWAKTFNATAAARGSLAVNTESTYQMKLEYLRTQTDTKFLARPKLLTLNNETAEISVTKDEIVGREDKVETTTSGTTTTYTFIRSTDLALTKEGTGIFLRVTPQVNPDTGEITMVVNPKSSVTSPSTLSAGTSEQADVEVRTTRSIVKIKDGDTVVLGGLIHHDKGITIKKLPILGDLPFIGSFFRHKEQTSGLEREMIVFITPRIVKDKIDISRLSQVKNIQLPIREQGVPVNTGRDYIINANMNNFEKNINGKR